MLHFFFILYKSMAYDYVKVLKRAFIMFWFALWIFLSLDLRYIAIGFLNAFTNFVVSIFNFYLCSIRTIQGFHHHLVAFVNCFYGWWKVVHLFSFDSHTSMWNWVFKYFFISSWNCGVWFFEKLIRGKAQWWIFSK